MCASFAIRRYGLGCTAVAVAMVALGLAISGCGGGRTVPGHANGSQLGRYATERGAAEGAVSALHVPPGLTRSGSCRQLVSQSYTGCFVRRQAVVLTKATWTRLLSGFGARVEAATSVRCRRPAHFRTEHVTIYICDAQAIVGSNRLLFQAESVTGVSAAVRQSNRPGLTHIHNGTEVLVTYLAHS